MESNARKKGVCIVRAGGRPGLRLRKVILPFCAVMLLSTAPAWAAGGDFSINFAAADPTTYNHSTGGGSWSAGFVTSLQGGDFRAGDIVSWLALVTVRSGAVGTQTIQLDFSFAAVNTGHEGAAISDIVDVEFNDGDGANVGSAMVTDFNDDSDGKTRFCHVTIERLDGGEKVVIRIDTRLSLDPGSSPTGNLWGQLDSGFVLPGTKKTDTISTGKQTVPFQKVGDIQAADLQVVKLVSLATQTVGDAVASLAVDSGTAVKYWFTVTNPGAGPLYNVVLMDDNGTPDNISDDFQVTLTGLAADGSLAGGASATGVSAPPAFVNTGTSSITITNTATATGTNPASGNLTGSATATVTVGHENHAPVANDDSYSTDEDTVLTVPAATGVLANDTDLDGDALTAIKLANPSHGTVTLNSNGSFTYTPETGYYGDDTFTYKANDGQAESNVATVTITVNHVNHDPVAADDEYTTMQEKPIMRVDSTEGVRINDTDPDGDPLTVSLVTDASHGKLSLNDDGSFTYNPDNGFAGIDTFSYKVSDGNGGEDTADVILIVHAKTSRRISVDLQMESLTYVSPSLSGEFTITNSSNGKRTAIKIDALSLVSIRYMGLSDIETQTWHTVPAEDVSGLTFDPAPVISLDGGDSVTVTFTCSLANVPEVAAFEVEIGAQVSGL
jgi:VCBS repeat-containing protein